MNGMAPPPLAPRSAEPAPGTQFPHRPPSAAEAAGRGSSRIKIGAVITAVAIGITGGALFAGLGPAATSKPVAEVRLEATSSAGTSPFMPPVGQDRAGVVAPTGTAGKFAGNTPGLYGEDADKPSCDAQGLITNLAADQTKSAAWAQALGITATDIPDYVGSLNPVVLRSDTAVTEHGYETGAYSAYPAVLQAGTSTFVNSFGEPTVKCFSGNPLTKPGDYAQASYVGQSWQSFAPTAVTYVDPTPTVIEDYTYVDFDHGSSHHKHNWCWDHRDSKHCEHPNPDHWCNDHRDSDKCKPCDHKRDCHDPKPDCDHKPDCHDPKSGDDSKKDDSKKDGKKDEPKKDEPKKDEPQVGDPATPTGGGGNIPGVNTHGGKMEGKAGKGNAETVEQTGDKQTGDKHTGDKHTGDKHTGDKHTGDKHTGDNSENGGQNKKDK